ncbi:MAG: thymidine phosphorylase [Mycoplasmataceae bacterium]|nr:thymidine phosphorylase [Mycoplasmataceae bacterium]
MIALDIINKKKNKIELSNEEINFFVNGFTKKEIPDYQMSSLLMAILLNGMSELEISNLTEIMMHSGDVVDLSSIKGIKLDKHSTGGVGDKTSLVLGPIVASCGGIVSKMSGRGLGHTGGTIDKLESIPNFNCFLSIDEFKNVINKIGISIIGQTDSLVPADKAIYSLRDATGTVDSLPLIASSIMSKKLATGSDAILLDIKCGNGAFMKDLESAQKLGNIMIKIGRSLKKDIRVEITNMNQPLGIMIGNKNEIIEVIRTLSNKGESNFVKLCLSSASTMLVQAGIAKNELEGEKIAKESLLSGKALAKFYEFIEAQGGDVEAIKDPLFWNPSNKIEVLATENGFLEIYDSLVFGNVALKLGAGRKTKTDKIDFEAGIELNKITNDHVKIGDILFTLYSTKVIDLSLIKELNLGYKINNKVISNKIILDKIK